MSMPIEYIVKPCFIFAKIHGHTVSAVPLAILVFSGFWIGTCLLQAGFDLVGF